MAFVFQKFAGRVSAVAIAAGSISLARAEEVKLPSLSGLSVEYSVGVLNGMAQEYVYSETGRTVSRLDWKSSNVAMFQTAGSLNLTSWLRAGLWGATSLSSGGTMDDYDFDIGGDCPETTPGHDQCHSWGPSKLRQASLLDAYLAARFFREGGVSVEALAGGKYDYYKWQAIGGDANYGTNNAGNGISYEQTWASPYLGLGVSASSGAVTFNGRVIGSVLAKGEDRDNHHLRSLLFTENFGTSNMIGADAGIAYRMSPSLSLTANYRYQNWMIAKGPTSETDLTNGHTTYYSGDAAGGNNVTHTVSLGVKVDLRNAGSPEAVSFKDAPVSTPVLWDGWYAGVGGGMDWQVANWKTTGLMQPAVAPDASSANAGLNADGNRAALFAGRAWGAGQYVWGVEVDAGKSNSSQWRAGIPGTGTPAFMAGASDAVTVGRGWDASFRARAGYLYSPVLQLYATGGLAIGEVNAEASCPGPDITSWCLADRYETTSKVLTGWTAGAGYDWAFAGNWFTRGEYRYTDLGSFNHEFFASSATDSVSAKIDAASHQLTFGLGYRF